MKVIHLLATLGLFLFFAIIGRLGLGLTLLISQLPFIQVLQADGVALGKFAIDQMDRIISSAVIKDNRFVLIDRRLQLFSIHLNQSDDFGLLMPLRQTKTNGQNMVIFVRISDEQILTLNVWPTMTIAQLRVLIDQKTRLKSYSLEYRGRTLRDSSMTLDQSAVQQETLLIVQRMESL